MAFAFTLFAAATLPGLALAASAEVRGRALDPYGDVHYRAWAGEANRLLITRVDQASVRIADGGAVIVPGDGCRSIDAHTVECTSAGFRGLLGLFQSNVALGDMDDTTHSVGVALTADAGPGNDNVQLAGGVVGTLDGGGGRDVLLGGDIGTTFIDGDLSGGADSDVMDGRGGTGIVNYERRTAPVHVDLADPGPDGEAGENDVLRSVTGAVGGSGSDILRGDDGRSILQGGAGADLLTGRAGDDQLFGGAGADRLMGNDGADALYGETGSTERDRELAGPSNDELVGGAGDDRVQGGLGRDRLTGGSGADSLDGDFGRDLLLGNAGNDTFAVHRGADRTSCGAGRGDALHGLDRRDLFDADCDWAEFEFPFDPDADEFARSFAVRPYPRVATTGYAVFTLRCPALAGVTLYRFPRSGRIRLRAASGHRRKLGAGRIPGNARRRCRESDASPRTTRVRVRLNANGRRLVARPGNPRITVSVTGRGFQSVAWTVPLVSR